MHKHVPPAHPSQAETEDEIDTEGAFGEHDITYWVRAGNRLVPATPGQIAAIQEREAYLRLALWRSESSTHPLYVSHLRRIGKYMRRCFSLSRIHLRQPGAPHTPDVLPTTNTECLTPRSATRQEAARERHV